MTESEMISTLKNLKRLARFMDKGWGIPFTRFRFGADSVIGLVPGAGDIATTGVSLYIVLKAYEMGAPGPVLARMLGNIAIDAGVGAIPVIGDIFDAVFMSNIKNIDLLIDFMRQKGIHVD